MKCINEQRLKRKRAHTALYSCLWKICIYLNQNYRNKYISQRIILFTDGQNESNSPQIKHIKKELNRYKIILDVMELRRLNNRTNISLQNLCHQNYGLIWNPSTADSWKTALKSPHFLFPWNRKSNRNDPIILD